MCFFSLNYCLALCRRPASCVAVLVYIPCTTLAVACFFFFLFFMRRRKRKVRVCVRVRCFCTWFAVGGRDRSDCFQTTTQISCRRRATYGRRACSTPHAAVAVSTPALSELNLFVRSIDRSNIAHSNLACTRFSPLCSKFAHSNFSLLDLAYSNLACSNFVAQTSLDVKILIRCCSCFPFFCCRR